MILPEVLSLVIGSLVHSTVLSLRQSCGIVICLLVPFQKGSPSFWEGLLRHCKQRPGKYYPFLIFMFYLDKLGLKGLISIISYRIYFLVPSFLLVYRGGEVKIKVNEKN